jgi:hypothetical protein
VFPVLWPETSSPSPSRPLLFSPFHRADSAFELNKAYVSTLLPSYCVCSHHRSISLPLRWQAPNIQISPILAGSLSIPRLPHSTTPLTEQEHEGQDRTRGARAKVTQRKRPLPRETWGMFCVLAETKEPSQAEARITQHLMLPSRCPSPITSSPQRVVCAAANPRHPTGPHRSEPFCLSARLCLPLPCPAPSVACVSSS